MSSSISSARRAPFRIRPFLTAMVLAVVTVLTFVNCNTGSNSSSGVVINGPAIAGPNVLAVQVGCHYANEPCVSVTICAPGTATCQTINNILLDTGSYGLRLFSQAVTIGLTNVADPNHSGFTLAECISYGDGSEDWGPLAKADIIMGGSTASNVSIQIINKNFASYSTATNSNCQRIPNEIETSPSTAGFNGILGVGLFTHDCDSCAVTQNGTYYSCSNSSNACSETLVSTTYQTANPIAALPTDNNGLILELPTIPTSGAQLATGSLVFGIGTESNNSSGSGVKAFAASTAGYFGTSYKTTLSQSFIDSGSNGLYFPDSSIAKCSDVSGFFCPANLLSLTAVQYPSGSNSNSNSAASVSFQIGNADTQLDTRNVAVFPNLGGPLTGSGFDWGLPFFFGRSVYVGFENNSSTLGTGPLWAY